ncbi:MAG: hypothetical protein GY705_11345 [Bacteroidetes bacterium]|nr:hypothetical protein [Bacteroidota bacterium]
MEVNISIIFFALFIVEQVVMVKLGSYPYYWGIPFAHRNLPNDIRIEDVAGFIGRLKIKKDDEGNIFFRYKHFPLTWGPYVFVGIADKDNPTELTIRLGPLTGVFFLSVIVQGLFYGLFSTMVSLITVGFFLYYFFYSFLRGYEKILQKEMNKI